MVISYFRGEFPSAHTLPTVSGSYTERVNVGNSSILLTICDSNVYDEKFCPLSWLDTDVFLVCYSIGAPTSLDNVAKKWLPAIRRCCANTPFLLVGTKSDLRDIKIVCENDTLVDFRTAEREGQENGASCVMECSALTAVGLREVFDKAIRAAIKKAGRTGQLSVLTNDYTVPPQVAYQTCIVLGTLLSSHHDNLAATS